MKHVLVAEYSSRPRFCDAVRNTRRTYQTGAFPPFSWFLPSRSWVPDCSKVFRVTKKKKQEAVALRSLVAFTDLTRVNRYTCHKNFGIILFPFARFWGAHSGVASAWSLVWCYVRRELLYTNQEPPQKFRRCKGDVKEVLCRWRTNVRQHTKFMHPCVASIWW